VRAAIQQMGKAGRSAAGSAYHALKWNHHLENMIATGGYSNDRIVGIGKVIY
jgi:hypothetical protein